MGRDGKYCVMGIADFIKERYFGLVSQYYVIIGSTHMKAELLISGL